MASIDELNKSFAIPDVASFEHGTGDLPRLTITAPAAEGHIYLHGAHVAHFQPRGKPPVLFLSTRSNFADGKPIRGGVPIIFPWFGPRPSDNSQMHGIVRTRAWEVVEVKRAGDGVRASFSIRSDESTRA